MHTSSVTQEKIFLKLFFFTLTLSICDQTISIKWSRQHIVHNIREKKNSTQINMLSADLVKTIINVLKTLL